MIERRRNARSRVIYGGVVGYNRRQSTWECVIRNFSEAGASVEFDHPAMLPDVVDLLVARKHRAFRARIAWRGSKKAGLAFEAAEQDTPMPLDWILRMRASRSEHRELQNRLAETAQP
ncbi:MAG TPA: PilZ domain-containing protein [Bradyrhizobium sp.]|jgi:PilZ domain|nr:PilZ domain-containing protein [Bradyrhizobium sp.]